MPTKNVREDIPVAAVRAGDSLAILRDGHRVLFQVENVNIESTRQPDGTHAGTCTLTSEPIGDTGKAWQLIYPMSAIVTRLSSVEI